ncbi:GNAT family N-acyltransferase [Marinimicrobium alkaliphilum]|uniref:GNAT family N-acyltransferase n=1 Tax=Marinimicrobium alkaliphilum TaxID=2202654 RepID=UPI000DBA25D8|nr:lysophospholipid acyltransferase family protein [Marinimicrobium alkaliphilum]
MLDIESSITRKFPNLARPGARLRQPAVSLLRKLIREQDINHFLKRHQGLRGLDFIDRIFEHFDFSYRVSERDRANIPAQGRVVIVANHPIGSLDGLALLRLISAVRPDVKIVANELLMAFEPLHDLLLPLDNMSRSGYRRSYKAILGALEAEQAVIIFPAGEVSRARPQGIRDGAWQTGFLHFARKAKTPVLPVLIEAKNSLLFYGTSALFKPFSTALLAREMFNKRSSEISLRVGDPIPAHALDTKNLADKALLKRLKKHLYQLGKNRRQSFVTEKTISHPEDPRSLRTELESAELLGNTRDQHRIYLCDYHQHPRVLREIGRLRELTFRLVGEGTGSRRDLDRYDTYYRHLVLWDEQNLCIAGAYRLGDTAAILEQQGIDGLYTAELFRLRPSLKPYLREGLELGRSFVNPAYWGKASLDYLWQGLGAYLARHPHIRYLIGPVSLSAEYPKTLQDLLVFYFQRYYYSPPALAGARHPHFIEPEEFQRLSSLFEGLDRDLGFALVQQLFAEQQRKVPVLFKQYPALYEPGGYQLLAFSVDSAFGHCVDGLFMGDLQQMKEKKKTRYLA